MTDAERKRGGARTVAVPQAGALEAAALADYAEGAVVSRTIAETDGGIVTLFAFDAGQQLSEHSAPFDAIVLVLDGEAELTVGGRCVRACAGQLVIMPANVPHSVKAAGRFKMLLTMLRSPSKA
ncbi:MAG TPA: cupin domain-containing protein [Phycisphaerae bacterium]|nr:cupin domain-containing protein [Phycisphaerae bacterium]